MAELVRLNKYISESGMCSRREADRYIETGQVKINGKKAEIGSQVNPYRDRVMVNGLTIEPKDDENMILMAFNKPVGITSTTEPTVKDNIVDYISYHERIFPIGRLDKDSQGLIFMTNNGDIVNKILRAGNNHEKEYIVTVDKPITDEFISKMGAGVPILGTVTKKCRVVKEGPFVFRIILVQGLNRQIRRMCECFDYNVVKLERIRIMNISLKGIALGDWRLISGPELDKINSLIADSASEASPKTNSKSLSKSHSKTSQNPPKRSPSRPIKATSSSSRNTNNSKHYKSSSSSGRKFGNNSRGRSR